MLAPHATSSFDLGDPGYPCPECAGREGGRALGRLVERDILVQREGAGETEAAKVERWLLYEEREEEGEGRGCRAVRNGRVLGRGGVSIAARGRYAPALVLGLDRGGGSGVQRGRGGSLAGVEARWGRDGWGRGGGVGVVRGGGFGVGVAVGAGGGGGAGRMQRQRGRGGVWAPHGVEGRRG